MSAMPDPESFLMSLDAVIARLENKKIVIETMLKIVVMNTSNANTSKAALPYAREPNSLLH